MADFAGGSPGPFLTSLATTDLPSQTRVLPKYAAAGSNARVAAVEQAQLTAALPLQENDPVAFTSLPLQLTRLAGTQRFYGLAFVVARLFTGGQFGVTWRSLTGQPPSGAVAFDVAGSQGGPFMLSALDDAPEAALGSYAGGRLDFRLAGAASPGQAARPVRVHACPLATWRASAAAIGDLGAVLASRTPSGATYLSDDQDAAPVQSISVGASVAVADDTVDGSGPGGYVFAVALDLDATSDATGADVTWAGELGLPQLLTSYAWPPHRWYLGHDTTPPDPPTPRTAAPPMRLRQRDDGLGASVIRVRAVSSRQRSSRARGYW